MMTLGCSENQQNILLSAGDESCVCLLLPDPNMTVDTSILTTPFQRLLESRSHSSGFTGERWAPKKVICR